MRSLLTNQLFGFVKKFIERVITFVYDLLWGNFFIFVFLRKKDRFRNKSDIFF